MTHGDEGSKLRYGAFCRVIKKNTCVIKEYFSDMKNIGVI